MNFLVDLFSGRRQERTPIDEPRPGAPRPGEPLGFYGRLSGEQEAALRAFRDDDTVGDPSAPDFVRMNAPPR